MLVKPFGGQFTFNYYPHINGESFDPPAQTPSIYVFDDKPDIDAIDNGTNAIGVEITTWGEGTADIRTIVVPAIADPGGTDKSEVYYLGIKYVAVASGSATYDVIPFTLARPDGFSTDPTPTAAEVKLVDLELETFFPTDSDIDEQIAASETKVIVWYKAHDVIYQDIHNPEEIKNIVMYKTLADLYMGQRREPNDFFDLKFQEYDELYKMTRDTLKLQYDANKDDEISKNESEKTLTNVYFKR